MPAPLFNELLDDQLMLDVATDFRGGANGSVAAHLLLPGEYAWSQNCTIDPSGGLATRGGTEQVTVAANCTRMLPVAITNVGAMYLFTGAATSRHTGQVSSADPAPTLLQAAFANHTLVAGGGRAYIVSDNDVHEYDGISAYLLRRLQVTLSSGGSGYTTAPAVTVTPAVGNAPVEAAVVETTLGSGASAGQVVAINVINPGRGYEGTPTLAIDAPGSGTTATATPTLRVPPTGALGIWHTNRLFIANEDTLSVSDFFDPGWFAAGSSMRVGGDGHPITGLKSWDNYNLLVFKAQSVWLINTDPQLTVANWSVEKVSGALGCAANRTATQVGADVWWLSSDGVVSLRRMLQETQREVSVAISLPIQSYLSRVNWAAASLSCAEFFDNKVFFALPLDGAAAPSHIFVYDTLHQRWVGEWVGLPVRDMSATVLNGQSQLIMLLADGTVVRHHPAEMTDLGVAIPTTVDLRGFSFGDPTLPKTLLGIIAEFNMSTSDAEFWTRADEGMFEMRFALDATSRPIPLLPAPEPFVLNLPGTLTVARTFPGLGSFHYLQVRIRANVGRLCVRALKLTGFADTVDLTR